MRTSSRSAFLVFCAALALTGVSLVGTAHAQTFPREHYKLIARHSDKCVDVSGWNTADGAAVIQWDCHGGANQQWRFQPVTPGEPWHHIVSRHTGKVLDVFGWSGDDGAQVHQWTNHGGANQQWRLVEAGGGWYKIINRHTGKALDIEGISRANGARTVQWGDWGGWNQQFRLEQIQTTYACNYAFPADYLVRFGIPVDVIGGHDGVSYQESRLSPWRNAIEISFSAGPAVSWWKVLQVLDAENNPVAHFETADSARGPILSRDVLDGRNPATLKLRFAKAGFLGGWAEVASFCNLADKVGKSLGFHWYRE